MKKAPQGKILLVEDDNSISNLLKNFLNDNGFFVHVVASAGEVRKALDTTKPDLLILDRKLPDGDGMDIIRSSRLAHSGRIILMSGIDDPIEKVLGLELGADDYITKPFHMRELLARVRAVLRRNENDNNSIAEKIGGNDCLAFMGWLYMPARGTLQSPTQQKVHLTWAEQRVLGHLISRPGRIVSKDELYTVFSNRTLPLDNRSVEMIISSLRRKLGDDPQDSSIIRTVRAMGYSFIAPLEETSYQ